MDQHSQSERGLEVFASKRNTTRYQILVEVAERQPAVSQQEIADSIGMTAQAVSDYVQGLISDGFVQKHGRGRYEITKEGVDWLMSQTDEIREYIEFVSESVIGQVDVETAIAEGRISSGQPVSLSMREGVLRAVPGPSGEATAVAITGAEGGQDVGVTDFEGILEYEPGTVTIVSIPSIQSGGSQAVDATRVGCFVESFDKLAIAGVEAVVLAASIGREPDIRFGTVEGVTEAATKGLDVVVLVVESMVARHATALRENTITYEVIDGLEFSE